MIARIRKAMEEKDQGFTLIELLVVIIIIGILAAIAIPVFLNQRKKAVDSSLKSDVKNLATLQETWLTDNPSAVGTGVPANLVGFKKSPGNVVEIGVTAPSHATPGYCIRAWNPNSSIPGGPVRILYYDSALGGILSNTGAGPIPGGACNAGVTFTAMP